MPSLVDATTTIDKPRTWLLYGPPGTGKTIASASFPTPMYVFDFDAKLIDSLDLIRSTRKDFTCSWDEYLDMERYKASAWRAALKKFEELLKDCSPNQTVVIDSLTFLGAAVEKEITVLSQKVGKTLELQQWYPVSEMIRDFISRLRAMGCHVVCTAHEELLVDEVDKSIRIQTSIPGKKLNGRLAGYFSEVYRFFVEEQGAGKDPKYGFYTKPGKRFTARTQLPGLDPIEFWNPFVPGGKGFYDHVMGKALAASKKGVR